MCPVVTVRPVVAYLTKFNTTSLINRLRDHLSTHNMTHPSITRASRVPLDGLVTSTWSFRLRMDFDVEILSSPLFSSKMDVGTAASSYFNTSFRLIALVLVNSVTIANSNHESHRSIGSHLHSNNLPLDRLVESCGTNRLDFLQLHMGFSNLNNFVADLRGDNADTILTLRDINWVHTLLQLVSDSIPVIIIGLDY